MNKLFEHYKLLDEADVLTTKAKRLLWEYQQETAPNGYHATLAFHRFLYHQKYGTPDTRETTTIPVAVRDPIHKIFLVTTCWFDGSGKPDTNAACANMQVGNKLVDLDSLYVWQHDMWVFLDFAMPSTFPIWEHMQE